MRYQDLVRYLQKGEPRVARALGEPFPIPAKQHRQGFTSEWVSHVEQLLEDQFGPTVAIRSVWIAADALVEAWLHQNRLDNPSRNLLEMLREILLEIDAIPVAFTSGPSGGHEYLEKTNNFLRVVAESNDPHHTPTLMMPLGIRYALGAVENLLETISQYITTKDSDTVYRFLGQGIYEAAASYAYLVDEEPLAFSYLGGKWEERQLDFLEWWHKETRRRIPQKRAQTDGPKLKLAAHSQSRSLREYYEEAFTKWKDKKGYVLWDSVKGVFDSVFNTSDFRQLTNSLGLPVTHLPGIGKALKAVGNFVLSSLWIAPKMAKAVVEETGLAPEKVEKVFAVAKGIDSVTPGPWGSGIIILYYALATAGKAPTKAAVKKALSTKAKIIERIREALEKNRQPKMQLVSGKKSSSGKDPLSKLTAELKSIAKDKKALEKSADKTADFALEIGDWSADVDESLDALLLATLPAHERLVSQGDDYDSRNLLDMSMYLADHALEDLEGEVQHKMAAGPRFD